jgi:uncharacterized lipoprotein YajG
MPHRIMALLASAAFLCGCATKPAVIADPRPFCKAVQHVCISASDVFTEPTAQQIEGNNLGRAPICGKPKPCKQKG